MLKLISLAITSALSFFRAAITEVKTTSPPGQAEINGGVHNIGSVVELFRNLKRNASPVFGNWYLTEISSGLTADTYTGAAMVGGLIRRNSTGATTDSTATGTQIVAAIPGAVVGQTFPCLIANMGSGALTVAANTGVTLAGTASITRFSTRLFLGTVTGSAAVTLTQCFQFSNAAAVG